MDLRLGPNALVQQSCQNSRLQIVGIRQAPLGGGAIAGCANSGTGASGDPLNLALTYGASGAYNGNLTGQQIAAADPSQALAWQQVYAYDAFNRLTAVGETLQSASPVLPNGVTANNWNAANAYDAFGNRAETASYSLGTATPTSTSQFSAATNRLAYQQNGAAMPGNAYDLAGRQTAYPDPLTGFDTIEYDAEGRMVQYTSGANITTYTYDGEGRRVSKTLTGAAASTTIYAYDASGQLSAEYSTAAPGETGTAYLLGDHLGSTRLVTNATGSAIQRFDYAPFGEDESAYGLGNRNLMASYGVSGVPTVKFTGKERDAETGLDYFGARYFSGAQGRFISPDWSPVPMPVPYADLADPQTLNLYTYVRNNPLSSADPDGHADTCKSNPKPCASIRDAVANGQSIDEGKAAYQEAQKGNQEGESAGQKVKTAAWHTVTAIGGALDKGSRWLNDRPLIALGMGIFAMAAGGSGPPEEEFEEVEEEMQSAESSMESTASGALKDLGAGLRRQIELHRKRLADYIADPDAHDNKGFLKNVSPELREKVIQSRIKSLEGQIQTFVRDLEKIVGGKE